MVASQLPDVHTDVVMGDAKPTPTLVTLPPELRSLIVSHLAPSGPEDLTAGCKADLKNANLAHPCLREWVPEYMFRDMTLECVIVGMASYLERFAAQPSNSGLLKHVKSIQVKVPTAIRWEVNNVTEEFDTLEDLTVRRLCKHFNVAAPEGLSDSQRVFALNYHRALVEPFTDSRRWYNLLRDAQASWGSVFRCFKNLQEIGVGCCERVDHPAPTYTNVFVTRYGKGIENIVRPPYAEDSAVNISWASAIVLEHAPEWVRNLRLSMANIDHFNSFATVNRLMSMVYRNSEFLREDPPTGVTKLSVTLRGEGMHGSHDWNGDTASAGLIRYWSQVLPSMTDLQYLEIHQVPTDRLLTFTEGDSTDDYDTVLRWLFRDYSPQKLTTLRLSDFLFSKNAIQDMFYCHWPALTTVIFDGVTLLMTKEDVPPMENPFDFLKNPDKKSLRAMQGEGWLDVCRFLKDKYPGLRIVLKQPVSNIHDEAEFCLHDACEEELKALPGVELETDGFYDVPVRYPFAPFDPLAKIRHARLDMEEAMEFAAINDERDPSTTSL